MKSRILCLILLLPSVSVAGVGVVEINQACALVGCHPGDVPGFPVTIGSGAGSSYRLTSDLDTSPDRQLSAIVVTADEVTLDLTGFSLIGPAVCTGSGATVSCSVGGGVGIAASNDSGLTVRDGTIRGFAAEALVAGERTKILNVTADSNGRSGFDLGNRSIVSRSAAHRNGGAGISFGTAEGGLVEHSVLSSNRGHGIFGGRGHVFSENSVSGNGSTGLLAGPGSTVTGNTAYQNNLAGIKLEMGSKAIGNTAYGNNGTGIDAEDGATIIGNSVSQNDEDGIRASDGASIVDNTSFGNGDGINEDNGIQCSSGCSVRGNSVRDNSGYGLSLNVSIYRENIVTNNATGSVKVTAGTINLGDNYCAGNNVMSASCP